MAETYALHGEEEQGRAADSLAYVVLADGVMTRFRADGVVTSFPFCDAVENGSTWDLSIQWRTGPDAGPAPAIKAARAWQDAHLVSSAVAR